MKNLLTRRAPGRAGAFLLASAALLGCAAFPVAAQTARRPAPTYVPGELLVKFSGNATGQSIYMANRRVGARASEMLSEDGWQRISLRPGMRVGGSGQLPRAA